MVEILYNTGGVFLVHSCSKSILYYLFAYGAKWPQGWQEHVVGVLYYNIYIYIYTFAHFLISLPYLIAQGRVRNYLK
jgi:hypothetical protein